MIQATKDPSYQSQLNPSTEKKILMILCIEYIFNLIINYSEYYRPVWKPFHE